MVALPQDDIFKATDFAIVDLDRRISRAITRAKGVKLSARDLDLLTSIGLAERLASAKSAALLESAKCRVEMRQVGVASVRSAWDTARIHLGLPEGWGPKLLRHSMSTILASRSINPVELKVAMGHAVFGGSTDRYVIFDPDYLLSFQQGVASVFADLARIAPSALLPPER